MQTPEENRKNLEAMLIPIAIILFSLTIALNIILILEVERIIWMNVICGVAIIFGQIFQGINMSLKKRWIVVVICIVVTIFVVNFI